MEAMLRAVYQVAAGPMALGAVALAGAVLTWRGRLFQFRRLPEALRVSFGGRRSGAGGLSPFQAVSTALAGTMGTGNLVGVASAILTGGPGAVFWMWATAALGMATKYGEIALAVKHRERGPDGAWRGGAMYVLRDGAGMPGLARAFAVCCAAAAFGVGNSTQVNAMAGAVRAAFGVPPLLVGLAAAATAGAVLSGGVRRIGRACALLIPLVTGLYLAAALWALCRNLSAVPGAFALIFREAFGLRSLCGGAAGHTLAEALRTGAARGIYSNEAGLGSSPMAHASADCVSADRQGLLGIFEVFADTIVTCTLTALVILTAPGEGWRVCRDAAALAGDALAASIGPAGRAFSALALLLFGFTSLVGWYHYGRTTLAFLTPSPRAEKLYRAAYLAVAALSAGARLDLLWLLSDLLNACMALPNIAGLLILCPQALPPVFRGRTAKRAANPTQGPPSAF